MASVFVSSAFAIPASAQTANDTDTVGNGRASTLQGGIVIDAPSLLPDSSRTVYRGTAQLPKDVFEHGFTPLGTNPDLMDHALGKRKDSNYVPTSADRAVAERFARKKKNGSMFVIQESGQAVDVNAVLGAKSPFKSESELAWPNGVPARAIEGVWIKQDGKPKWVPNRGYRPIVPAINSDPVLAQDGMGIYYDARTGKVLTETQIAEAKARADSHRAPGGITLLRETHTGVKNVTIGPLVGGRKTMVRGVVGEVTAEAARLEGTADGRLRLVNAGVDAHVTLKGKATVIGVQAQTGLLTLGDPNTFAYSMNMGANAQIGAEAIADANVGISTQRIAASGRAGAFTGVKAQADVTGSIAILGVAATATGHGEISFGLGASAEGYVKLDWSAMTMKVGGRTSLTLGLGGGLGGEIEVSLEKLLKNPSVKAVFVAGVDRVVAVVSDTGRSLCVWCTTPQPATVASSDRGFNGTRLGPSAAAGAAPIRTSAAIGAGIRRD